MYYEYPLNYHSEKNSHSSIHNFLDKNQCEFLINFCKETLGGKDNRNFFDGRVGEQILYDIRKSKIIFIPNNCADIQWLFEMTALSIRHINDNYFQYDLDSIELLQFTEYDASYQGFYGKHIDVIYNKRVQRKLSFSIQLSDPTDYQGGDLLLHNEQNPTYCPREQGTAIFFPSYTLHEVTPITAGKRYSIVGWTLGRPFR